MIIKYLKHNEIDKTKWDNCVENSINCLVYGMSWYLDIVCENWDALVSDDYEAVMPLPWKSKFGIKYIYHPFFAQQLGVFSTKNEPIIISKYLDAIPNWFLKYEFSLNSYNTVNVSDFKRCNNYLLSLNKKYDEILASYNTKCRRNVKLSKLEPVIVKTDISVELLIKLKFENMTNAVSDKQFKTISTLLKYLLNQKRATIVGAIDSENNLLGAAAFVFYKNRIIYLFSASNNEGKNKGVRYLILNFIIEQNSGKNILLDFEGSMLENIASFFKSFGGYIENYNRIGKSKIPFIK